MINTDKKQLSDLLDNARYVIEPLKKHEAINANVVNMYFELLSEYHIDQVKNALKSHLKSSTGQFFPKPADIIKHIDGFEITADEIIAAARIHTTPLGCLCRIHIGTWDLDNQDGFYLRQRAQECLQLLPQWKARALIGEYSEHEVIIMLKYHVNPTAPFANGLQRPRNIASLDDYAKRVSESTKCKFFLQEPYRGENDKQLKLEHSADNEQTGEER